MALKRTFLFLLMTAAVLATIPARAEDSRVIKARQVRDEILEKRRKSGTGAGTAVRPDVQPAEDPFDAAVAAARERLAGIDALIEDKRRQAVALAAPREKLAAKSDELGLQVNAVQEQNRARVEAIYRSAKLGAGAAGWHPEPARSARLSRYLASVAAVQQRKLEVVELEQGNVIASLDRARAEDQTAANELHVLDADRVEALASLERVTAEAGGGTHAPGEVEADAGDSIDEREAEMEQRAAEFEQQREAAMEQQREAALESDRGASAANEPAPGAMPPGQASESALAIERAMALLEARKKAGPAIGEAGPGGQAGSNGVDVATATSDTGAKPADPAKAEAEAKALAEARAALEAKQAEAKAAEAKQVEAKAAEAKAAADAKAAQEKSAAEAAAKSAAEAAAEAAAAKKAEAVKPATPDPDGLPQELDDGPAVLAPASPAGEQVASVRPSSSGAPAGVAAGAPAGGEAGASTAESEKAKRPGLLSRFFGSDRESDAFAASRGALPPPVAGKVVANYGQQHKSGATYRGVILRSGHSAPIKAVAGGKVSFAGNVPGLGNTVIVSHGDRYHTVYARLGTLEVKEGQSVAGGTELGVLPDDNADMHFELRDQGKAIDPVPWLKGGVPGATQ